MFSQTTIPDFSGILPTAGGLRIDTVLGVQKDPRSPGIRLRSFPVFGNIPYGAMASLDPQGRAVLATDLTKLVGIAMLPDVQAGGGNYETGDVGCFVFANATAYGFWVGRLSPVFMTRPYITPQGAFTDDPTAGTLSPRGILLADMPLNFQGLCAVELNL